MRFILSFFIFILLFWGCQKKEKVPMGFYYWQTTLKKDSITQKTIFQEKENYFEIFNKNNQNKDNVVKKHLFIRLFDVDYNPESASAEPVAIFQDLKNLVTHAPKTIQITPVVFITNQTMRQLKKKEVEILAKNIWNKVIFLLKEVDFSVFQIDCDWNETTKANFFHFINTLKTFSAKKKVEISLTIRLHQIKFYKKTGIPPVKMGTLMAYNMGNVRELADNNSILDNKILGSYLAGLPNYPLELDLALPLFSWVVVLRQGNVVKLLPQEGFEIEKHTFLKENFYEVTQSQYSDKNYYLYKGDILKLETTHPKNLSEAVELLQQFSPKKRFKKVIFYHLEKNILEKFSADFLNKIIEKF